MPLPFRGAKIVIFYFSYCFIREKSYICGTQHIIQDAVNLHLIRCGHFYACNDIHRRFRTPVGSTNVPPASWYVLVNGKGGTVLFSPYFLPL